MKITIHSHGSTLAEDFLDLSKERLNRLTRFNIPIDRVEVDVIHEINPHFGKGASHRVKITFQGSGPWVRAEGRGINDLAAFDEAAEAVELQLRKIHERAKDFKRETLRKRQAI